jgi:hypothetical protein
MTSWVWLAVVDEEPGGADAAAPVRDAATGAGAGWLALWDRRAKPVRQALRADRRMLDPCGGAALVSLVLTPPGVRVPVDDLAVKEARREVLRRRPPDAVSILLRDASHFQGAVTVLREGRADDPFARLFPARLLEVGPGAVGRMPAPAGPVIERYGSANPWPWDRYEP